MKKLLTLFINPWFFMITGGACFGIMALDYLMHKNCDVMEFWNCLSFIDKTFAILFIILIPGNVLVRIIAAIVNSIHTQRKKI